MRGCLVLVLVVVAGCWRSTPPPQPPQAGPEPVSTAPAKAFRVHTATGCAAAIDRAIELSHDELERIASIKDSLQVIRDAAVDSCEAQRWSSESLTCFAHAVDSSELGSCQSQLTSEQNEDLSRRMVEAMSAGLSP
ncbi:MAG: hypothetical protein H6Q90_2392 [Deltaproteobacteria bacterium]|nr:hypothetical protein [Deltaproteobacteria bacterium]